MKTLLHIFLYAIVPLAAVAQQEGPNAPSSTENQPYSWCVTCAGAIWDSTENVSAIDGEFSSVTLDPYLNCFQSACYRSRYLTCYNYGFNIPANAVIEGISVSVIGVPSSNGSVRDCTIVLRRDNLNNLFGNNMATTTPWNTNNPDHTYGGITELWGLTWTPADINSSDFGVYIKLYNPSNNQKTVDIDAVFITVTYSLNMEVFSVTSSPQAVTMNYDASQNALNISTLSNTTSHVSIIDMTGRVCLQQDVEGNAVISTEELAPGVYTASTEQGGEVFTRKFVR